ncbi:hypothetical protein R3P38DRAFT_3520793 [Favolaschia claudopus]|uniref:Uncharacterized protein n=1 Tax=Favolaschia claudopus TaxID=2862362 RepID=A0AAW0BN65_9AGAR
MTHRRTQRKGFAFRTAATPIRRRGECLPPLLLLPRRAPIHPHAPLVVVGDRAKGDAELYNAERVKYEEWWSKKFAPGLVETSDGTMYLDTPFSRLLGKPPIMVAGMTPSTVQAGFVSAVLNAGYHIELAGGGHYNAAALPKIPAGVGITLNALYINQRQFEFQLPLWQEMRKEGLPVEGFCVAAGIPSTEKAAEIIEGLKSAGIRHVAFKPGSVEDIRHVVNIAAANPDFPLQCASTPSPQRLCLPSSNPLNAPPQFVERYDGDKRDSDASSSPFSPTPTSISSTPPSQRRLAHAASANYGNLFYYHHHPLNFLLIPCFPRFRHASLTTISTRLPHLGTHLQPHRAQLDICFQSAFNNSSLTQFELPSRTPPICAPPTPDCRLSIELVWAAKTPYTGASGHRTADEPHLRHPFLLFARRPTLTPPPHQLAPAHSPPLRRRRPLREADTDPYIFTERTTPPSLTRNRRRHSISTTDRCHLTNINSPLSSLQIIHPAPRRYRISCRRRPPRHAQEQRHCFGAPRADSLGSASEIEFKINSALADVGATSTTSSHPPATTTIATTQWFGWKKDGSVGKELGDMTYEETVLRMVKLMFVSHEKRWKRFAGVNGGGNKPSLLQSYTSLDDPLPFIESFFKAYPIATRQLLAAEDSAFFLAISQRPGHKLVPFIPVLNVSFEVWFKKVYCLWAAEDIEAVFDQDPQRVCILQGPMAVKHSKIKDEPIKDLLGNINSALIQLLLDFRYGGDANKVPTVDYLSIAPAAVPTATQIKRPEVNGEVVYGTALPDTASFSDVDYHCPRHILHRQPHVSLARSYGEHKPQFKAVEIKFTAASKMIDVTMFEDRRDVSVPLTLQLEYKPSLGYAPIHEIAAGRNTRIKEFYWKPWYGNDAVLPDVDIRETFYGPEVTIEASDVEQFEPAIVADSIKDRLG